MQLYKVVPAWTDARGTISDLVNGISIQHVGLITSRAGTIRGNHLHREVDQYACLLRGRMLYFEQEPGKDVATVEMTPGQLVLSPAGASHAFKFLEDSVMLVLTTRSRAGGNFEDDTVRLEHPLVLPRDDEVSRRRNADAPTGPFGDEYAQYYDLFYRDKPYDVECDFLEAAFARFAGRRPRAVLDVGCGTGGHLARLTARGYEVTGVDASESMVRRARARVDSGGFSSDIRCASVQHLNLGRTFDAAVCMFSVLGYLTEDDDLLAAFGRIRAHLAPGGLLVFDYHNGITSVTKYLPHRMLDVEDNGSRVIRLSTSVPDVVNHVMRIRFESLVLSGGRLVDQFTEDHSVRFFFPREMRRLLEITGFRVLHTCPFPRLDDMLEPTEDSSVGVVAQADDGP